MLRFINITCFYLSPFDRYSYQLIHKDEVHIKLQTYSREKTIAVELQHFMWNSPVLPPETTLECFLLEFNTICNVQILTDEVDNFQFQSPALFIVGDIYYTNTCLKNKKVFQVDNFSEAPLTCGGAS